MRIKHKGGDIFHVLEEAPSYYIVVWPYPGAKPFLLEKQECEEVKPEPTYENITSHCHADDIRDNADRERSRIRFNAQELCRLASGYRFVKVCDCDPMPPVAFIIERINP